MRGTPDPAFRSAAKPRDVTRDARSDVQPCDEAAGPAMTSPRRPVLPGATRERVFQVSRPPGSMSDQTYDDGRARNLEELMRTLAARILELDARGELLKHAGELMRMIGDVRSELFHYEVRATYDTPEIAESRRIVSEADDPSESTWEKTDWTPEEGDETEW
jgi:hypothetical protein